MEIVIHVSVSPLVVLSTPISPSFSAFAQLEIGQFSAAAGTAWQNLTVEERAEFQGRAQQRKEGSLSCLSENARWQEMRKAMNRISQEVRQTHSPTHTHTHLRTHTQVIHTGMCADKHRKRERHRQTG